MHGGGEIEVGEKDGLGQDLLLDLGGEDEVVLVLVALAGDFGGEAVALAGDEPRREGNDEKARQA